MSIAGPTLAGRRSLRGARSAGRPKHSRQSGRTLRAYGRCRSRGRTERAHRSLENASRFPQPPQASNLGFNIQGRSDPTSPTRDVHQAHDHRPRVPSVWKARRAPPAARAGRRRPTLSGAISDVRKNGPQRFRSAAAPIRPRRSSRLVAEPMPAVVGILHAAAGCGSTCRGGSFFRAREAGGRRRLAWAAGQAASVLSMVMRWILSSRVLKK